MEILIFQRIVIKLLLVLLANTRSIKKDQKGVINNFSSTAIKEAFRFIEATDEKYGEKDDKRTTDRHT